MKQYKYVLFDWDGCLAKTLEVWLEAFQQLLDKKYGKWVEKTDIAPHLGDYRISEYFGIEDTHAFNVAGVEIARDMLGDVELYDGALDLLKSLRGKVKIALVSSSSRHILDKGLAHNGLSDFFDIVISGDDVTNHKPHPESLEKALAAIGGDKEHAIMIGDSTKDMGAANNFGIDSALILHPSHELIYDYTVLRSHKPTYEFTSLGELRSLFA